MVLSLYLVFLMHDIFNIRQVLGQIAGQIRIFDATLHQQWIAFQQIRFRLIALFEQLEQTRQEFWKFQYVLLTNNQLRNAKVNGYSLCQ